MFKVTQFVVFAILVCDFKLGLGLEYSKQQRYNPNTDFLVHESSGGSGSSAWPKRDYVAPNNAGTVQNVFGTQDYNSQFPSLGTRSTSTYTTVKPSTTVQQQTTRKTQSGGKRDYVAPQLPATKPQTSLDPGNAAPPTPVQKPQTTGKRDYVAPQFTTTKPQQTPGRVKDLVNFYDSKSMNKNGPQNTSSYSSVIQGNKQGSSVAPSTGTVTRTTSTPTKPLSFSSVVAGPNKHGTPTTSKPSTQNNPLKPNVQGKPSPTPGRGPVLPSSLVNNNRNNNQGNGNSPTDAEIQSLSEDLLRKDNNNAAKYITVNYQEKTNGQTKEDKAPLPLLTIAPDAWNIPTVQKLVPLLDNYERDTMINEYVTPQERNEENAFMDAIMSTTVIRTLMNFLKDKGYVTPDPRQQRDFLKQLWFNLYSRGKGKISSSGFEHIFVSELKNGDVQGLHNWVYFSREEAANRLNYLGYMKYQQLGDKGVVMKLHFNQQGLDKPVDTLFIGTSPELEIALYTLCFVTRADNDCKLRLGSKDVDIVTHTFRYRSKNYIGSAYPQI
ncbi:endoribonuclease CG2145-like [Pectinophora gossypiella]|uniref:endoribonuclease CG2145-like n=1 Tax=Pectinophora gossypiella TaxID=13191 RepID=UPI00214EAB02|nr:endoribonuclease CG2145-like [Pectinophora gossypiella]